MIHGNLINYKYSSFEWSIIKSCLIIFPLSFKDLYSIAQNIFWNKKNEFYYGIHSILQKLRMSGWVVMKFLIGKLLEGTYMYIRWTWILAFQDTNEDIDNSK